MDSKALRTSSLLVDNETNINGSAPSKVKILAQLLLSFQHAGSSARHQVTFTSFWQYL
jgi:hypothetical protein